MESSRFWRLLDQDEAVWDGEGVLERLEEGLVLLQRSVSELRKRRDGYTPQTTISGMNSGSLTEHSEEYLDVMPLTDVAAYATAVAANIPKIVTRLTKPSSFESLIGCRAKRPRRSSTVDSEPKRQKSCGPMMDEFLTSLGPPCEDTSDTLVWDEYIASTCDDNASDDNASDDVVSVMSADDDVIELD